jgi:ssDNA-binding replication factor A large subunit
MIKINIQGLDKLQRELKEAERAFSSLDGTITTLQFNPDDPASVQRAMREMDAAIDQRVRPYSRNPLVSELVLKMKAGYREQISKRARQLAAKP